MMSESTLKEPVAVPAGGRELAVELAQEAGALLRGHVARVREIDHKGTIDLVTEADRASEALIAGRIRDTFPWHRLIGEEGARGALPVDSASMPFGWVVDPLDGTTNFAHGYPHFAVSIALEHEGEPILGVVYDPMRDELFVAERGRGATLNGEPIRVSTPRELIGSLLATGFPYDLSRRGPSNALWDAFNGRCQGVRRDGAAALNLCYVAAGRLDGFWEQPLQAWDIGAGVLLVCEAGGTVTALDGGRFDLYDHQVLATNGHLHAPMLAVIAATTTTLDDRERQR